VVVGVGVGVRVGILLRDVVMIGAGAVVSMLSLRRVFFAPPLLSSLFP
jgi:hypothetical protein